MFQRPLRDRAVQFRAAHAVGQNCDGEAAHGHHQKRGELSIGRAAVRHDPSALSVADHPAEAHHADVARHERCLHFGQARLAQQARAVVCRAVAHLEARVAQLIARARADAARRMRAARQRPRPRHDDLPIAHVMADGSTPRDGVVREEKRIGHAEWVEDQFLNDLFVGFACYDFEHAPRETETRVVVRPDRVERRQLRQLGYVRAYFASASSPIPVSSK